MYSAKAKPFKKGSAISKLLGWSSAEAKTPPWGLAKVYDTPIVLLGLRSCCNPRYHSNLNKYLHIQASTRSYVPNTRKDTN